MTKTKLFLKYNEKYHQVGSLPNLCGRDERQTGWLRHIYVQPNKHH